MRPIARCPDLRIRCSGNCCQSVDSEQGFEISEQGGTLVDPEPRIRFPQCRRTAGQRDVHIGGPPGESAERREELRCWVVCTGRVRVTGAEGGPPLPRSGEEMSLGLGPLLRHIFQCRPLGTSSPSIHSASRAKTPIAKQSRGLSNGVISAP